MVGWWRQVAPSVTTLDLACRTGKRGVSVAAARAAMVAIARAPIPVGEERAVAEWFGVCALIADTWRQGDPEACTDAHQLLRRCVAGLYESA